MLILETRIQIEKNVPLAPLTTLGVGGAARFFVRAESEVDLAAAIDHARRHDLDVLVMGGGSNMLVSDAGFDGMAIQVAMKGIELDSTYANSGEKDRIVNVTAHAGEDWDGFVAYCVDRDLAGVECLSGIPGFVGGTPVQNVGAYGQEVSETIVSVRCLDRESGRLVDLSNADCGFAYRTSIFNNTLNNTLRDRYVVTSVTFGLTAGGRPKVQYKDLKNFFADRDPGLVETRAAVLKIRAAKSMVIDRNDPNSKSAGSFFKNPVVDRERFDEIASRFGREAVPHFDVGEMVKIPAAWLIEKAGFGKGFSMGNAGISSNHSLALINRGGATAAEIVRLKDAIVGAVEDRLGIRLTPEPVFVGFD